MPELDYPVFMQGDKPKRELIAGFVAQAPAVLFATASFWEGVDVRGVAVDPDRLTALVILGIRDESQFPLIFYRENCADMALSEDDIDPAVLAVAKNSHRFVGQIHFHSRVSHRQTLDAQLGFGNNERLTFRAVRLFCTRFVRGVQDKAGNRLFRFITAVSFGVMVF